MSSSEYADHPVDRTATHPADHRADHPAEADEADLAEQRRPVVEDDEPPTPSIPATEANEADVLEQGAEVAEDDEDYR